LALRTGTGPRNVSLVRVVFGKYRPPLHTQLGPNDGYSKHGQEEQRGGLGRDVDTLPTVPRGFKLWKPIFFWRLALRGADSILAPGRLYRCLPGHRRLCSLRTPSRSLLVQVDRPKVTNQQPDSSRPS